MDKITMKLLINTISNTLGKPLVTAPVSSLVTESIWSTAKVVLQLVILHAGESRIATTLIVLRIFCEQLQGAV